MISSDARSMSRPVLTGARSRPALILAAFATGLLLAGCADASGDVDAQGHNGYDVMTCQNAKALALDIEHGTVMPTTAQTRISDLTASAGKASDPMVRQATQALVAAYQAKDRRAAATATTSLVKSCQM